MDQSADCDECVLHRCKCKDEEDSVVTQHGPDYNVDHDECQ